VQQYKDNYKKKHPKEGAKKYAERKARSKTDINISFAGIISSSKRRAKEKQMMHDMTLQDLNDIYNLQKGLCALTGVKMKTVMGSGDYMMSPDRINSKKGYTRKNVQLTLSIANKMKQNLTTKQFVKLCKTVVEYHNS
jgi:hypothetical protein